MGGTPLPAFTQPGAKSLKRRVMGDLATERKTEDGDALGIDARSRASADNAANASASADG